MIDYEVAEERMAEYRRQAKKSRTAAEFNRQEREAERRRNERMVVEMIHEIVSRLSFRSHETVRG